MTKKKLRTGEPCDHPGCLSHVTHPCEGCGRIAGKMQQRTLEEYAAELAALKNQQADFDAQRIDNECLATTNHQLNAELAALEKEKERLIRLNSIIEKELITTTAKNARLAAVVERYPKTKDGIPITPKMTVWGAWEGVGIVVSIWSRSAKVWLSIQQAGGIFERYSEELFSTREAAEAAKAAPRYDIKITPAQIMDPRHDDAGFDVTAGRPDNTEGTHD